MPDRKEGTHRITIEQLREIFMDYLKCEVLQVPNNHVLDIHIGRLNEYGVSEINYRIRHEDDKEETE